MVSHVYCFPIVLNRVYQAVRSLTAECTVTHPWMIAQRFCDFFLRQLAAAGTSGVWRVGQVSTLSVVLRAPAASAQLAFN
jgi:hypothetical protein